MMHGFSGKHPKNLRNFHGFPVSSATETATESAKISNQGALVHPNMCPGVRNLGVTTQNSAFRCLEPPSTHLILRNQREPSNEPKRNIPFMWFIAWFPLI
jgi:hypothetical protein